MSATKYQQHISSELPAATCSRTPELILAGFPVLGLFKPTHFDWVTLGAGPRVLSQASKGSV